ncbi:hypothetical protein [Ralstonia pseudosolanacearum]|uniref:hypothetical protein n=1 Tax=Ralstonia pseudosolanacearum TaxID=1310165 RepID=UPI003CEA26A2
MRTTSAPSPSAADKIDIPLHAAMARTSLSHASLLQFADRGAAYLCTGEIIRPNGLPDARPQLAFHIAGNTMPIHGLWQSALAALGMSPQRAFPLLFAGWQGWQA